MGMRFENISSETRDAKASVKLYKIVSYPADFTLRVLFDKWNDGELIIPKFQRRFVWSIAQASRLIESFLMGLPVPEIFLYKEPSQKQIIIDGHQRLQSIFSFFSGEWPDGRVFYLRDVNERWLGRTFEELRGADRRRLRDSVLRSIFVEQLDPDDATSIYHVFERLNTGGTALNPQEVRNCVYHGPFNDLLVELNQDPTWREIVGSPDPDKRMRDVELITRFLALAEAHREYERPMKDFISSFMQRHQHATNSQSTVERFHKTVESTVEALGGRPFHVKRGLNAAVFDSVMTAFALRGRKDVPANIKKRYRKLLDDEIYLGTVTSGTTAKESVTTRIRLAARYLFR